MGKHVAKFTKGSGQAYFYDLESDLMTLGSLRGQEGTFSLVVMGSMAAFAGIVYLLDRAAPIIVNIRVGPFIIIYQLLLLPIALKMRKESRIKLHEVLQRGKPMAQTKQLLSEIVTIFSNQIIFKLLFYIALAYLIPSGFWKYVQTNRLGYLVRGALSELLLLFILYYGCDIENFRAVKRFKEKLKAME